MTDLWCAFGAMAANPTLFAALPAEFERFDISITEKPGLAAESVEVVKNMGALIEQPTLKVQAMLQSQLDTLYGNSAPIVSLWTAGRMCRLKVVDGGVLATGFTAFQACVKQAFAVSFTPDVDTATAMGAAMIDDQLRAEFLNAAAAPARVAQFRLHPSSAAALTKFLSAPGFVAAQTGFLQASCWDRVCPDRMIWYADYSRAAN